MLITLFFLFAVPSVWQPDAFAAGTFGEELKEVADEVRLNKQTQVTNHINSLRMALRLAELSNTSASASRIQAEIRDYEQFIIFLNHPYSAERVKRFEELINRKKRVRSESQDLQNKIRLAKLNNQTPVLTKNEIKRLDQLERMKTTAERDMRKMLKEAVHKSSRKQKNSSVAVSCDSLNATREAGQPLNLKKEMEDLKRLEEIFRRNEK